MTKKGYIITGIGILVGLFAGYLYFVPALHAVWDKESQIFR